MNALSRNMMLGGFALVVAGLIYALVMSYRLDHESRLAAYDAYKPVFEAVLQDNGSDDWQEALAFANRTSLAHRRAAAVHTHSVNMGVLLILVGLLAPLLGRRRKPSPLLSVTMIASAFVYPGGLLLKSLGLTAWGEALAALGAAMAIAAMLWLITALSHALETAGSPE